MHFKQPQIIYTNRWRNLQCSGGGDEMGREETRRDGQRREGGRWRQNEMGIGKPKPKRFEMVYIYCQNGVVLSIQQCPKRRPSRLSGQVFILFIYLFIY